MSIWCSISKKSISFFIPTAYEALMIFSLSIVKKSLISNPIGIFLFKGLGVNIKSSS